MKNDGLMKGFWVTLGVLAAIFIVGMLMRLIR